MSIPKSRSGLRTLPQLLLLAYVTGTVAAALALHVAISFIAPGDGGTALVLSSGVILFVLMIALAIYSAIPFLALTLLSWPVRELAFSRPLVSLLLSAAAGAFTGKLALLADLRVGPGDNWSGPLVGVVYGAVWFVFVRKFGQIVNGEEEAQ